MGFKEDVAEDVENVVFNAEEFAEATTFTPSGGSAQPTTAIWIYLNSEDVRLPESTADALYAEVSFIRSKLSSEPARDDLIANAKGETFVVLKRVSADDLTATYRVVLQSRIAIGSIMERLAK